MATTPCTLVILTDDKIDFPIKVALVVMKQIFQYGVKSIRPYEEKIIISLTYSPKNSTLKQKFGNLPIRYMRIKVDDETCDEDFKILENVATKYKFNMLEEDVSDESKAVEIMTLSSASSKRKRQIMPLKSVHGVVNLDEEEEDKDGRIQLAPLKKKTKKNSSIDNKVLMPQDFFNF